MQNKKQLHVIQNDGQQMSTVATGKTCFSVHAQHGVNCNRQRCQHWIDHPEGHNCVLIAVQQQGSHTLQKIGQIYGLTRMRICQIEKGIFEKIRKITQ